MARVSRLVLPGLLTIGLGAGSCGSPTGPSPTPSSTPLHPDVLLIEPSIDWLGLGSTETLTAVVVSGNGSRRTVAASWSSDTPEIVAVDDGGRVRGVSLGKTTVHASFQALSAAQPIRVVPDYEGVWAGSYRVVTCQQISGNVDVCDEGGVLPIGATLARSGGGLSGTLQLYSSGGRLVETGPISGSIDDSGGLALMGTTTSVEAEQPGDTTVTEWHTTLAGNGDEMAGTFVTRRRFRNFFGWQETLRTCELITFSRSRP
jgi:hypothetical protein